MFQFGEFLKSLDQTSLDGANALSIRKLFVKLEKRKKAFRLIKRILSKKLSNFFEQVKQKVFNRILGQNSEEFY